uniref:Prospero domain-containing protein n=1 Tax=Parascaris equorum TaxID=6256 RepID=A0A914S7C9_PAREQ
MDTSRRVRGAWHNEFFYNQMDKYARNYLAEGVKNKEDIIVTPESEIYKNLNQHYNRNNHIQPPERLASVIQETLREFFSAIQNGRDAEPSWKKTIYKIINRMDDPIPEYFKDPNFLERLEG